MSVTRLKRNIAVQGAVWSRPGDWLSLPTLSVGDEKAVGLVAVQPNGTLIAVTCQGAYTVDWGDGTVTNYASNVKAEHTYAFSGVSSSTLTSDGNRQALVTITPQAGAHLTYIHFDVTPTSLGNPWVNQWRDIAVVAPNCNDFGLSSDASRNATRWLTWVGTSQVSSLQDRFRFAWQLRGITGTQWTANATSMQTAFQNCMSLVTVPAFDTSSLIGNISNVFTNCYSLQTAPMLDFSRCTGMVSTFNSCFSLTTVPLYDTGNVTNFQSTFGSCLSLPSIPLINTAKATTFNAMFASCGSLTSVPALNSALCTDFSSMFSACGLLTTIPLINTSAGVNFSAMFSSCSSLASVPALDTSNGVNFSNMFQNCFKLGSATLNTSKGTAFSGMFLSTYSLQSLDIDCTLAPSAAAMSQVIATTPALSSLLMRGMRFAPAATALNGLALSAAALNAFYTALGTASGAQTLTVSSNPGSGSSTTSIATAKGWTVVGG